MRCFLRLSALDFCSCLCLVFLVCLTSKIASHPAYLRVNVATVTGGVSPNRQGWVGPFAGKLTTETERDKHKVVTDMVHSIRIPTYSADDPDATERGRICLQVSRISEVD